MSWVTFEAAAGGIVMLQAPHIESIYDEQGVVKLATASGGVHVLKAMTVRQAAAIVSRAMDGEHPPPAQGQDP